MKQQTITSQSEIRAPDAVTLEAVYNINKHAKRYARLADENYHAGKKATARTNSLKKKALYGVKSRAINRFLLDGADALIDVERHQINGDPFLCLYFEDEHGETWSFHQPETEVLTDRFPDDISISDLSESELDDFESCEMKERSDLHLKDCLLHLEACGINANEFLETTHVFYGNSHYFAGWPYLGEGGEQLTDTSETESDPEAFAVGDVVTVSDGTVREITDMFTRDGEQYATVRDPKFAIIGDFRVTDLERAPR